MKQSKYIMIKDWNDHIADRLNEAMLNGDLETLHAAKTYYECTHQTQHIKKIIQMIDDEIQFWEENKCPF